jgi:ACS family tartrate transporter-like MFS transporter
MVSWGIVSACMALVTTPTAFYALRLLLGVAEAGFFPGIILYLSFWFPARHRAGVVALFMAAAPISTALGSPISGALLEMQGILGLHGWQWLFLIEAVPAIILGTVVLFYMTDRPEQAVWLAEDERAWLTTAMRDDRQAASAAATGHHPLRALADRRVLALSIVYFGTSAGLYTLGIWAPQIIRSYGLSAFEVGLVNAVPAIFAIMAMVMWARHSDRTGERVGHVAVACLCAAAGLALASQAAGLWLVMVALLITNVGISASKPPLWALPTTFLSGASAAAGIAAINSIGNLGGFVGPTAIGWLKERTGGYGGGLLFVSSLLILSALLVRACRPFTSIPGNNDDA